MLVIRIELWSAITGKKTEIGRMHLWNDGTEASEQLGNYEGAVLRKPDFDHKKEPTRTGVVKRYRRLARPVWDLVAEMLINMGYGPNRKKDGA
jgi:hypothetical protein